MAIRTDVDIHAQLVVSQHATGGVQQQRVANLAFRKKRSLNDEWSHMFTFDDLCAPTATRKLQR